MNATSVTCVEQTQCGAGQKISHFNATVVGNCSACGADTYQTATEHRLTSCTAQPTCGAGQKISTDSATAARSCSACPANTYQTSASHRDTSCTVQPTCGAGEFLDSPSATAAGVCTACPADTYQNSANHRLTSCTAQPTCGAGQKYETDGTKTTERTCPSCPANTYQTSTSHRNTSCTAQANCAAGEFASTLDLVSARVCDDCPAGQFTDTQGLATSCTACDGTTQFQDQAGQSACKTIAAVCNKGTKQTTPPDASTDRVCSDCPADTYQDETGQSDCKPQGTCGNGHGYDAPSLETERVCTPCSAGRSKAGDNRQGCAECPTGEFSAAAGATTCAACATPCSTGQITTTNCTTTTDRVCQDCDGATQWQDDPTQSACKSHPACGPGELLDNPSATVAAACAACPADTYQDAVGHRITSCTAQTECAAGEKISADSTTAARSCSACPADTYQDATNHRVTDCKPATVCPIGRFVITPATASSDRACSDCDATSTFSNGTNAASCTDQTQCAAGEKITGNSATNAGACEACPSGRFQDAVDHRQAACKDYDAQCWTDTGKRLLHATTKTANIDCEECTIGQYEDQTIQNQTAADRLTCKSCPDNSYQNETGQDACENQPFCGVGQYISSYNATTPGTCHACPAGKFQINTGNHRTQCSNCTGDTFQDLAGKNNCTARSLCPVGQGQSNAPDASTDRTCAACVVNSTFSSANSAAPCHDVGTCGTGEHVSQAPTASSDVVCSTTGNCTDAQYESKAPVPGVSDRECTALTECNTATEFESKAPVPGVSNRECNATRNCDSSTQYQTAAPTATTDRQCADLTVCTTDQYENQTATATTDRQCKALTTCTATQFEAVPETANTDRQCVAVTVCDTSSQYQTVAPNATTNRECASLTTCSATTQYENLEPTLTTDRGCAALTTCTGTEYENLAPTLTSDRTCAALTTCTGTEFENLAPTPTSDRGCAALTTCTASQFESTAHNATTDRTCAALTTCNATQYESTPPTATTDRVCLECAAGNARLATSCTPCAPNTTSSVPGAAACTACPAGQYQHQSGQTACVTDCALSAWSAWDACTASCGTGTQGRTRTEVTAAQNGGAACSTNVSHSRACNDHACPVDCTLTAWSNWGACGLTCGDGLRSRERTVDTQAAHGGAACDTTVSESEACNDSPCPVNCTVSEWSSWSDCTKACGTGSETRTRSITQQANNSGTVCPSLDHTRDCNTHACPVDCVMSSWDAFSTCSVSCGDGGTRTRSRSVVTVDQHGGTACPTILGQTQECNAHACPVDCAVSDWSAWSACPQQCCNTVLSLCPRHTRTRSAVTPVSGGGVACPQLQHDRRCASEPCNFHPAHPCGIPFGVATDQACAEASPHVAALARTMAHHRCCAQLVQCDNSSTHDDVRQKIQGSCTTERHAQLVNNPVEMSKEVRKLAKSLGLHGQTFYAANDNLVGWAPGSVRLDSSDKLMEAVVHMARHNEAANEKPQWHFVVCWDETPGNEVCKHAVAVSLGMDSPAYQVQDDVGRRLLDGMTSPAANSSCAWNEASIRHGDNTTSCGKILTGAHAVGDVETWARPKNNPNLTFTATPAVNLTNPPPAVLAVYNGTLTLEDCKNQCHKPWRNNSNVECVGILWNITLESCITLKSTNKSDYEDGGAYGLWWKPGIAEFDQKGNGTVDVIAPVAPADDGGGTSGAVVGAAIGGSVVLAAIAAAFANNRVRRNARQRSSGTPYDQNPGASKDPTQVPAATTPDGADVFGQSNINALLRPTASLLPNNFNW